MTTPNGGWRRCSPRSAQNTLSQRGASCSGRKIYLDRAPVAELNPLWNDKRDWLPGQPAFTDVGDTATLAVSERVLDFLPGGLLRLLGRFSQARCATMDAFCYRLIGVFFVTVGSLHRVFAYHWHRSWPEAEAHHRQLAELPEWSAFMEDNRPRIVGGHVTPIFRPSPVPWMRALFDPIDWTID